MRYAQQTWRSAVQIPLKRSSRHSYQKSTGKADSLQLAVLTKTASGQRAPPSPGGLCPMSNEGKSKKTGRSI